MKIYDEIAEFSEYVSIIGVRYLFDINKSATQKTIWTLLMLAGVGLCGYQIADRIIHYLEYTTSTDISVVMEKSLRFPQVTICSESLVSKQSILDLGL